MQNRFVIFKVTFALVYSRLQFAGYTLNYIPGIVLIERQYDTECPNRVEPCDAINFGENGGNSGFQGVTAEVGGNIGLQLMFSRFQALESIFGISVNWNSIKICMSLISNVTVYNKLADLSNKWIKYTFISPAYSLITLIIIIISILHISHPSVPLF